MRLRLAGLLVPALLATPACGVVTVRPESVSVVGPVPYDQTVSLKVFATNPDAAEDERMDAFVIAVEAPGFRPDGVRFILPPASPDGDRRFPPPTAHPYVFDVIPGREPVDPAGMSDLDTVLVAADSRARSWKWTSRTG